jgi:hypothetical protein
MYKKSILFFAQFLFLFLLSFFFTTQNFAQTVTGSNTDLTVYSGGSAVVDNALTITCPGPITDASVLIVANFKTGDLLTIDNAALPAVLQLHLIQSLAGLASQVRAQQRNGRMHCARYNLQLLLTKPAQGR